MAELTNPEASARVNWNITYKFQTKQYESLTLGGSLTDDVRPDESNEEALERVYETLSEEFTKQVLAAKEAFGV